LIQEWWYTRARSVSSGKEGCDTEERRAGMVRPTSAGTWSYMSWISEAASLHARSSKNVKRSSAPATSLYNLDFEASLGMARGLIAGKPPRRARDGMPCWSTLSLR